MVKDEIKFRLWCETDEGDEMLYLGLGEFDNGLWFNSEKHIDKHIDIMLSTTLKDKNSKEIYRGDIVKCGYGIGQVVFKSGCFMIQWIDDKEAYLEFAFSRKGMYTRKDEEEFEIIGNIYENLELLT